MSHLVKIWIMLTDEQRELLHRDGYVVIPNVISENLADATLSEFQGFHAHATGQQFDPEHYDRALEFKNVHGIIEFPGALSHTDFVNRVRNDPAVHQVFSELHDAEPTDPIAMGMDRVNYQASTEQRGIVARDRKAWWHIDQKWSNPELECFQGYVDIVGSETDEHGGLMVLAGSHHLFEDLALAYAAGQLSSGWDRDWHRLEIDELDYLTARGCHPVNVKCPKGGMVIWDSRTVHMSRPNRHPEDERFVIYTCGFPESWLNAEDFERRKLAVQMRRATSSWPDARHFFPAKPQWFGTHSEEPQQIAEKWINQNKQ